MGRKAEGPQNTVQVRLYPTPTQAKLLAAHTQEYIATVNMLVKAFDAGMIEDGFSTKDFTAALPSACKNQALRDAKSVFAKAQKIGHLPILKKPLCQWNNQNWQMEPGQLTLPVSLAGKTQQITLRCVEGELVGEPGILRIKKKRGKWIADITMTLPQPEPSQEQGVMGVDLGIKVPAVSYVQDQAIRFYGNDRSQRYMRRRFYARRKSLQRAGKKRALRKSQGKESRWMKNINHQLSRQIVTHAQRQAVGTIRLETLLGIREHTIRTSRGAKARKNNRMSNTWSFAQLAAFITYKAERLGIRVERVDPAYTSQECPACGMHNKTQDRRYRCAGCGWKGHRDSVGAIAISRRLPTQVSKKQPAQRVHSRAVRKPGVSGRRKRATGT